MGLPRIAAYSMPRAEELPRSRASWAVEPARAALLVHDAQHYFLSAYSGHQPVSDLLTHIARLLEAARAADVPVYYTAQVPHRDVAERGLQGDLWGPGMTAFVEADPGIVEIAPEVAPHEQDVVLTKWRYSAFSRSDLADRLVAQGRDQLLITGVYASIGCLATAFDAFCRDVQPFMIGDALADFSRVEQDAALSIAASRCGAVLSTKAAVGRLTSAAAPLVHAGTGS